VKRRRKLGFLLGDIRSLLAGRTRAPGDYALVHALHGLAPFLDQLSRSAAETRAVLEVACLLRASGSPGRQVAEERLMGHLQSLAWRCSGWLEDAHVARLPDFSGISRVPSELQPVFQVLRELHDFALTCFTFSRPRDSFGGRRRALAFDILAEIGLRVDLPEVVSLARRELRKAQSVEARQAANFLKRYFAARELSPDEATTEVLFSSGRRLSSCNLARTETSETTVR